MAGPSETFAAGIGVCFALLATAAGCAEPIDKVSWAESVHEAGRAAFHEAIRTGIAAHPQRDELTSRELIKIEETESRYERLYEMLINVYYQKDAVAFEELLELGDRRSRSQFRDMYLELAELAAQRYIESFFATDEATPFLNDLIPAYEGLDAVDLVIRSTGYGAKLDLPERDMFTNPVSPEFDRQGGLDGGRFREAHEITKGSGVRIAILDTGIDESHSVFEHTTWGTHFSLVERSGPPWASDAPVIDWGAHGTLISSVAARYAPEAQLTMYKFGDGELQNDPPYQLLMQGFVAATIYRAVHDGNDIISISAAGSTLDSGDLRGAVEYAYAQNRIVLAGTAYQRWAEAGFTRNYPGQYPNVVSVTAAEPRGDGLYGYWPIASRDPATTVAGPNDIFGAFPTYMDEDDTYIPSISAAIPAVAATFALAASVYPRLGTERPGVYADQLMQLIIESANPQRVGFDGFSVECGYGLIDAAEAVRRAAEMAQERQ